MIDLELIEKFRRKVNEKDFVYFKYRNVKGKNQWNCICSAMDWITVAMEYIIDVQEGKKSCKQSMEMYAYIASIDVVWEAVQQLHRVFFNGKSIPFKKNNECFFDKILDEDDNTYFKSIRASFGAHPVNLKNKETNEKYFASWSGDFLGNYSVLRYSNKVGVEYCTMYLKIDELNGFLNKRYNYINQLMNEIDRQYEDFKSEMENTSIKQVDDTYRQLVILKEESNKRLNLYEELINELLMIFKVKITNEKNKKIVNDYKQSLKPLVNDIYEALQNMGNTDVNDDILYQISKKLPNGYNYFVGKLSSYIYVGSPPSMIWEDRLQEIFQSYFIMEYSSPKELYILIHSCINKLNNSPFLRTS